MKIDHDVLVVLDQAETDGNGLKLIGQLDRKLYERTNKVLGLLGGKWNRKAQAHLFNGDAGDLVSAVIVAGEVVDPKKESDAFYTPDDLAAEVVRLADVRPGMMVLEPSAGGGALAKAAVGAGAYVTALEIQQTAADALMEWLLERGGGGCICTDFMQTAPGFKADRVVMNPPFSRQQDIAHVMHAVKFVKPGGRLVAIVSAGVKFRENAATKAFRAFVSACGGTITDLPKNSFKESGTTVSTVLVVIDL